MKRNNYKYTHGRTCVYNINYHIIWGTKYRNKWMTVDLENEIKQILHDIASENGFTIDHIEIINPLVDYGGKENIKIFFNGVVE